MAGSAAPRLPNRKNARLLRDRHAPAIVPLLRIAIIHFRGDSPPVSGDATDGHHPTESDAIGVPTIGKIAGILLDRAINGRQNVKWCIMIC